MVVPNVLGAGQHSFFLSEPETPIHRLCLIRNITCPRYSIVQKFIRFRDCWDNIDEPCITMVYSGTVSTAHHRSYDTHHTAATKFSCGEFLLAMWSSDDAPL